MINLEMITWKDLAKALAVKFQQADEYAIWNQSGEIEAELSNSRERFQRLIYFIEHDDPVGALKLVNTI